MTLAQLKSPDVLYCELFIQVQTQKVFKDYKTFVDCIPKKTVEEIMESYEVEKKKEDFSLRDFVLDNFHLPENDSELYVSDTSRPIELHIDSLWRILTKKTEHPTPNASTIGLPHPYVVPGGRFREFFYWDSYFIMLGLQEGGHDTLIKDMVDNFTYLIDSFGFIPNGNRTYFLSRSQPPFYALMVSLMAEKDPQLLLHYLPELEKEHKFWMTGKERLSEVQNAYSRVVRMPDGEILNRFWDDEDNPRPEAYGKELNYTKGMSEVKSREVFRDIRAACESGWDFSTRWFKDEHTMQTIHTVEIVPVDLNCLLYFHEKLLARAFKMKKQPNVAHKYLNFAKKRKEAILKYFWSQEHKFFMDYDFIENKITPSLTLAGAFPLYLNIATPEQAKEVAQTLEKTFLFDGGYVTTLKASEFQWDYPNGWAPLQWVVAKGLLNYNFKDLAKEGARRWMELNEKVYKNSGKLVEKYNVVENNAFTGGDEYPLQDGFGWTNGVYLKLRKLFKEK